METKTEFENEYIGKGSYRTYEEWKRHSRTFQNSIIIGSYRTYEEWKHFSIIVCNSVRIWVLTVPMRNGNVNEYQYQAFLGVRSYRTYEEWKPLWISHIWSIIPCSYRTYEEWKH